MNTGDLLTVKEFAEKAGVSKQRIYKLMVDSLQPYTIKQENGYTMLKAEGLKVFGMYAELKPCNPVGLKPCNDEQMQAGSGIEPKTVETLQPYRVETLQQSVIDTQAAEIETLKQQLETLQDQLTAKDKQISLLQAHTADQQQTIQSLTAMLHPQQQLNAAAAVIQKQLIDQSEGSGQPSTGDGQRLDREQGERPRSERGRHKSRSRAYKGKKSLWGMLDPFKQKGG